MIHFLTLVTTKQSIEVVFWNLAISFCPKLSTLSGLSGLRRVGGEVAIINNAGLETTGAMGPLESVGEKSEEC